MTTLADLFLFSHGANALVGFILVLVSLRLYLKSGIRLVLLMSLLMSSWTITNSLLVLPLLLDLSIQSEIVQLIASWNVIGSAIVPSLFILFIDAFEGEIDVKKSSIAVACVVTSVFISLMGIISGDITLSSTIVIPEGTDLITMRWSPITSLAIFPTVILCGIWTQSELGKAKKHVIDEHQFTQLRFMKIGTFLMFFIGPVFGIFGVILVDGFNEDLFGTLSSEIIGYFFVSIGIIMVNFAYLTADEIAFLQPQRIDSAMVIYETGIPIFSYNFTPQENNTDVTLVSGAITAITALMSEAFNVSSNVKEINFHDKELLLDFQETESGLTLAFILFTDRKSNYLETALTRFATEFNRIMAPQLQDGLGLTREQENQSGLLLRRSFGLAS